MKLSNVDPLWLGLGALALGLGVYVWRKGGVAAAAAGAGEAVVDAAGGAVSGAVGAIGSGFGLPTPSETSQDPDVVRWIIDTHGYLTASKWAGAGALITAAGMPVGSGRAPSADSPAGRALLPKPWEGVDETDRLLGRYPAPSNPYAGYEELPGFGGPAPGFPL